jgi:hypothetical protein
VAAGGTIYDQDGKVLKTYEGRLPAVLEFKVPESCTAFTLEVAGQKFTQPLPAEHHGEEDEDHAEEAPKATGTWTAPPPSSHGGRKHRH